MKMTTDPAFRAAINAINQDIQDGECLSAAMRKFPQYFDAKYTVLIREGEVNGNLEISLQRLASGC